MLLDLCLSYHHCIIYTHACAHLPKLQRALRSSSLIPSLRAEHTSKHIICFHQNPDPNETNVYACTRKRLHNDACSRTRARAYSRARSRDCQRKRARARRLHTPSPLCSTCIVHSCRILNRLHSCGGRRFLHTHRHTNNFQMDIAPQQRKQQCQRLCTRARRSSENIASICTILQPVARTSYTICARMCATSRGQLIYIVPIPMRAPTPRTICMHVCVVAAQDEPV